MTTVITWEYKVFPDNTIPYGKLPDEKGAQACWWNFIRLHKIYLTAGSTESQTGTLLDTDDWRSKRYIEIKRSTGVLYQLDPDHIDKFWFVVTQEADRLGRERQALTGEPFDLPKDEYIGAKPGMVFEGHDEKQSKNNLIQFPTKRDIKEYGK